jgi:hypothetical protein
MRNEIIDQNMLAGDVLVIGKDIEALLNNFEEHSFTTYGMEYDPTLYRKGMEGKHKILNGPITEENIKWFHLNCFDIIYLNNIRLTINNFNEFFCFIPKYMHQHSNLYINIIGLNKSYFYELQETLHKYNLKLEKVTTHIKIKKKA